MTFFAIDDLEKRFKKMKFLEITKNKQDGNLILQYIYDKNIKNEHMLLKIRHIRNKKVVKTQKKLICILYQQYFRFILSPILLSCPNFKRTN